MGLCRGAVLTPMKQIKDTVRAKVRVGYDGRVHKTFRGTDRDKRYAREKEVLLALKERGCDFVPELLEWDDESLTIVTTNCGSPVDKLGEERVSALFGSLHKFGVKHGDEFLRNITYDARRGRFCVIDFELAELEW